MPRPDAEQPVDRPSSPGLARLTGASAFLSSYSNWFLLCAFVVTLLAKAVALSRVDGTALAVSWIGVLVAEDALICFGLAAVCLAVERRARWTRWPTALLGLGLFVTSCLSASYLLVSGELLTWQSLSVGVARLDEVWGIVAESTPLLAWPAGAVVTWILLATPYWCRGRWPDVGFPSAGLSVAALAGVVALAAPTPRDMATARLTDSAALTAFAGMARGDRSPANGTGLFGRFPTPVSTAAAIQWSQGRARPNVLFFVLESTRWDVTSLAGGPADTRVLSQLAERGLTFQGARAVVPHTTKSLWSILCGQYPLMQVDLYEVSLATEGQCLAHILAAGGYRRGFFQSALGSFEDRPRLVSKMGFDLFRAWENIGGEPVGFLGSDDGSLVAPFLQFVDEGVGQPFLGVLLTSATHFPYRVPKSVSARAKAAQQPLRTIKDRYIRLVEAQDLLMDEVLRGLAARGLDRNTIVVVLGDHGEGFGDQGVKQHDTNFFEEGLHVPLIIAGPGVEPRVVTQPASLLDVLPTLLEALELPYEVRALPGGSHLKSDPPPSPKIFGCWFDRACRGFVDGHRKVVDVPDRQQRFAFDLRSDPLEKRPLPLTEQERQALQAVNERISGLQTATLPLVRGEQSGSGWRCPRGEDCRHPASPAGGLHGW